MSEGGDGSVLDPGQQVMCFVATGSDNTLAHTHARVVPGCPHVSACENVRMRVHALISVGGISLVISASCCLHFCVRT